MTRQSFNARPQLSLSLVFYAENPCNYVDDGPYHIEISPLICSAKQWTGFYTIGTAVMKELKVQSKDWDSKFYYRWMIFIFSNLQLKLQLLSCLVLEFFSCKYCFEHIPYESVPSF